MIYQEAADAKCAILCVLSLRTNRVIIQTLCAVSTVRTSHCWNSFVLFFLVIWVVLCRLIKSFVQVCTLTLTLGHSTSTTAYNKNNLMTPCHKITTWMANQIILLYYCKFIFPEAFAPVLFIYFYVKQYLEFPFIVFLLLF